MKKVLLIIDDFGELRNLETILKKVGLDVLSLQKQTSLNETLLGFFPDIVIAAARSRQVDGFKIGARLAKMNPRPRLGLLYVDAHPPQMSAEEKKLVDAFITTPCDANQLIQIVAQLGNLDGGQMREKYARLTAVRAAQPKAQGRQRDQQTSHPNDNLRVSGAKADDKEPIVISKVKDDEKRKQRYDQFLAKMQEPVNQVLNREIFAKARQEAENLTPQERAEHESALQLKREFVQALFRKA